MATCDKIVQNALEYAKNKACNSSSYTDPKEALVNVLDWIKRGVLGVTKVYLEWMAHGKAWRGGVATADQYKTIVDYINKKSGAKLANAEGETDEIPEVMNCGDGVIVNAVNLGMVVLKAKEAEEVQKLLQTKGYAAAKKYCKDHQKEIEAVDGHRAWYFLDAALDAGKMRGVYNSEGVATNAKFKKGQRVVTVSGVHGYVDTVLDEGYYAVKFDGRETSKVHESRLKVENSSHVAANGKPKEVGEMNIIEKKLFDLIAKHPNGPSKLTKSAAVSYKKQAGATDDELDTVLRSYQFNGLADVKNEEETTEEVAKNYVPSDNSNTPLAYIKGTLAHVKGNPSAAALEGKAWKVIREKPNYKALAHTTEYKELDKAVGINSEVVPNSVIDKTGREVKIGSKVIIPIMGGGRTYTVSKLGDDGFATCEGEKGDVERVKCKELLVK